MQEELPVITWQMALPIQGTPWLRYHNTTKQTLYILIEIEYS
jgi:hypothetical protein